MKISRARARLEELTTSIEGWLKENPISVEEREVDSDRVEYVYRQRESVPEELGAIIGESLHCARTALDHLAWDLVVAGGGRPDKRTYFPIFDKPRPRSAVADAMKGASRQAVQDVFDLSPWRGGDDELWHLHELDIVDKHRLLLAVGSAHRNVAIGGGRWNPWGDERGFEMPILFLRPADQQFPMQDGAVLFSTLRSAVADGMTLARFAGATIEILFGPDTPCPGKPLAGYTLQLISRAEAVIDLLKPHL
ncbi:hypothetical protein [Dactylosporangium sp. CA-233914]|uniref:hypothetical protein n=1 Tax=Dactylosporangium sp. CA-233914 TaxID=3239934 RepID=UPI003D8A3B1B